MQSDFVHLHVHTEFSIVDGMIPIKSLVCQAANRHMNAIAVTDYCNLFAAVKFYKQAIDQGIKPLLGSELPCHFAATPTQLSTLIVLCQNDQGYRHLTCLISKAYQQGQVLGLPRVHYEWFADFALGLIVLSGGRQGLIGQALLAQDKDSAYAHARYFKALFPTCFYLEIQRTDRDDETSYNQDVIALAAALGLPLVATNAVCFLDSTDFDAHEARICINQGLTLADPRRIKCYSSAQYLRSPQEMQVLFSDLPEALENTVHIAKRCNLKLSLGQNYLPTFPVPATADERTYLSTIALNGLEARLAIIFKASSIDALNQARKTYDARLQFELNVINTMGFAGYFLIVADFIQWAKNHGIPVGPGRGSGAGSLVAYALKITDLDPLQYDLLFERFLNPERISMPDFDIDFCMEGRDKVIDYVAQKYGRQNVSQIITFGTMAAKAVIRDVGRVLDYPYGFVDKLAKLIPFEIGITLKKALEGDVELQRRYQDEEEVKELIDLALKLEGMTRNAGKHAGGVVIAPSQLTDFTAIYCEQDSNQIVSQFDKDDVEAVGLVKFDFLGLRTLTIIDWALQIINQTKKNTGSELIDISLIPLNDKLTFNLLKACQTTAVFQLESRGMKELIKRLQPDCFEDIVALVALFRPGPLQSGMVDDFIDRKHGRAKVEYPHPDLTLILKPTYGVILYQEQVMQIAQVLAHFTLGAADLLRRAMGKKNAEEMALQRTVFVEGAVAREVAADRASAIFDLMEKFAGYGFNKSHSAAYALLAYQTAWLKAHYPAAFMAAVLSSDMDNTEKVVIFVNESRSMALTILPPSINRSNWHFTTHDNQSIIYGLGAIKGVGESAVNCIVEQRALQGEFTSLLDFCSRLDLRKVNRRVLDALIKSGAMDDWQIERSSLIASLPTHLKRAEKHQQNQTCGQTDLFDFFGSKTAEHTDYQTCTPWSSDMRLQSEKETLGFYLTGHPACVYVQEFTSVITPLQQLNLVESKKALVCGMVAHLKQIMTKNGKKLVIITIEDINAHMDVVIYSELFSSLDWTIEVGSIVLIEGELAKDDFNGGIKMTALIIYSLTQARAQFANHLNLSINQADKPDISLLQSLLLHHPGPCSVHINYHNNEVQARLVVAKQWQVLPSNELIKGLQTMLGENRVWLEYQP